MNIVLSYFLNKVSSLMFSYRNENIPCKFSIIFYIYVLPYVLKFEKYLIKLLFERLTFVHTVIEFLIDTFYCMNICLKCFRMGCSRAYMYMPADRLVCSMWSSCNHGNDKYILRDRKISSLFFNLTK